MWESCVYEKFCTKLSTEYDVSVCLDITSVQTHVAKIEKKKENIRRTAGTELDKAICRRRYSTRACRRSFSVRSSSIAFSGAVVGTERTEASELRVD